MEKFHKYCLSVLLVIICSNISAQSTNDCGGNEDYKTLCELYSKLLSSGDCKELPEGSLNIKITHFNSISQKQDAGGIIESTSLKLKSFGSYHKLGTDDLRYGKYAKILDSYKKKKKEYDFVETICFKNKVSKIRNKDYLDLIS